MRIIGGEAKSRIIEAPKGMETRPTLDKIKESLFNILQFSIVDKQVLDLYAGSGALALEAISRGAKHAVLVDYARQAQKVITQNIQALSYKEKTRVLVMSDQRALQLLHGERKVFDIIFLDPPYAYGVNEVLQCISDFHLLSDDGIIVVEHVKEHTPLAPNGFTLYDSRNYRETILSFIGRREE